MLEFLSMFGNYEQRKVARYDDDGGKGFVSTAMVSDSDDPYETGILYKPWGNGVVIVQTYKDKKAARRGHDTYVKLFQSGQLPEKEPIDMGTNWAAKLLREVDGL